MPGLFFMRLVKGGGTWGIRLVDLHSLRKAMMIVVHDHPLDGWALDG